MAKSLTDKGVAALKTRAARYTSADPELRGHYIRVMPTGKKSFVAVTVDRVSKKQIWHTVGPCDTTKIAAAREQARTILSRVREGLPAVDVKGETFEVVAANWIKRHVDQKALRTKREVVRVLNTLILPKWRHREFISIRRHDVAALLDKIEDGHGARSADYALAIIRSICNWYLRRHEGYASPVVQGMKRQSASAQARERVLTDDEIRAVWAATETGGTYAGIVRLLLLCGQRRAKVLGMKWSDIDLETATWTLATEPREKGNPGSLVLPDEAMAVILSQPRLSHSEFIFAGRTDGPFNGLSKAKATLDAKLPQDMALWTIHDLRRTARSLMSRAGVSRDHAERTLGHALIGVEKTYDRHHWTSEKSAALRALADLIHAIVKSGGAAVGDFIKRAF